MFDLTPSERKGALVLLALVALGAVADLLRLQPVPAPEPGLVPAPAPAAVAPGASTPPAPAAPAPAPLDLNTASVAELDGLPGIGPVLAGRIVSHRDAHGPYRAHRFTPRRARSVPRGRRPARGAGHRAAVVRAIAAARIGAPAARIRRSAADRTPGAPVTLRISLQPTGSASR